MSRIGYPISDIPERYFSAFQNFVFEHSVASVPVSLYNLTKSVQDPYNYKDEVMSISL